MKRLQGSLTLDTSVLVEYLIGSNFGEAVRDYLANLRVNEKAYCSLHALSELFYIMCRLRGREFAREKIGEILQSNLLAVYSSTELALGIGEIKCERAISLADCSSIATAMLTKTRALFMGEEELKRELSRKPFQTKIFFLEDEVEKISPKGG